MTDSKNAHDYGSCLNFNPVGSDGYAIELGPVNNGDEVWWRWSVRLGDSVVKGTSQSSFATRDKAIQEAGIWWITTIL